MARTLVWVREAYLIEVAKQVEQLVAEPDVLPRGVEVDQQVTTAHHRVQKQARDVPFQLFLLRLHALPRHL